MFNVETRTLAHDLEIHSRQKTDEEDDRPDDTNACFHQTCKETKALICGFVPFVTTAFEFDTGGPAVLLNSTNYTLISQVLIEQRL
jgi:hypothetical protein